MLIALDGPAAGETFLLRRAPIFLRLVCTPGGMWDGLDQLDDVPKPNETLFAYRRLGQAGWIQLCIRGRGRAASGRYATGEYVLVEPQPSDEVMRSTELWQAWANSAHLAQREGT